MVGMSDYQEGWPILPGVLTDVEKVKNALEQKGFHVVTGKNLSRDQLRTAIEDFINRYGHGKDNRLIFYFAGHGHTKTLSYGDEMGYFVPVDTPNPNRDEAGFLAKSFNMESMEVYAKTIQSKHALFLFDSCFSGSIFSLSRAVPENISYKTSEPVRQFIAAGSAGETVPDESIFQGQFIRALNGEGDLDGDGYVTGMELGEFLQQTVINYSKGSQHPQYGKIRNPNLDKGDFVFSLLDRRHIEKSVDSIVQERVKLEHKLFKIKRERKRTAAMQLLEEEKRKLEEVKKRLKEERERIASLPIEVTTPAIPEKGEVVNLTHQPLRDSYEAMLRRDGLVAYEKMKGNILKNTLDNYVALVQNRIYKNLKIPLDTELDDRVVVSFNLYSKGNIDKPKLLKASQEDKFNGLAFVAILDSIPFPEFPADVKKDKLHIKINFDYKTSSSFLLPQARLSATYDE